MLPVIAQDLKIEAGFGSYSSILIISMPFTVSLYLPNDAAIIKIGRIHLSNHLQASGETINVLGQELHDAEITDCQPSISYTIHEVSEVPANNSMP